MQNFNTSSIPLKIQPTLGQGSLFEARCLLKVILYFAWEIWLEKLSWNPVWLIPFDETFLTNDVLRDFWVIGPENDKKFNKKYSSIQHAIL